MIDITPSMKAKMLFAIKEMKDQNKSFMTVKGADSFSVTLNEDLENVIVLGAEEVEGIKYFLCQISETY